MANLYSSNDFLRPVISAPAPDDGDAQWKDAARILHSPSFRRLQGKMQLFPIGESDILRTRLTHSLEVAEISTRIAARLNRMRALGDQKIDMDVVTAASLAHDIGHPPFGHGGELALNKCMAQYGGFEANAQTLRILSTLENRIIRHSSDFDIQKFYEHPVGLNLMFRTLASVIKYDRIIELSHEDVQQYEEPRNRTQPKKGIYREETDLLKHIKRHVLGPEFEGVFEVLRTIECQIMDIADDIAYSTYDLEDSIAAGISTPLDLCAIDDNIMAEVTAEVNRALSTKYGYKNNAISHTRGPKDVLLASDVQAILFGVFEQLMDFVNPTTYNMNNIMHRAVYITRTYQENLQMKVHMFRRRLSETLINSAVNELSVMPNERNPCLSKLVMSTRKIIEIEVLKALNFFRVIKSQRLMLTEERSTEIISVIFKHIYDGTDALIPPTLRDQLIIAKRDDQKHARLVSDYIASLTDEDAVVLYDKMHSSKKTTIFGLKGGT